MKEFLSGEMEQFNQEINTKLDELTKQAEERKKYVFEIYLLDNITDTKETI